MIEPGIFPWEKKFLKRNLLFEVVLEDFCLDYLVAVATGWVTVAGREEVPFERDFKADFWFFKRCSLER